MDWFGPRIGKVMAKAVTFFSFRRTSESHEVYTDESLEKSGRDGFIVAWLFANSVAVLALVAIYQLWRLPPFVSLGIFVLSNLMWLLKFRQHLIASAKLFLRPSKNSALGLAAVAVALDVALLMQLAGSASTDSLATPWQVVPLTALVLFILASLYVIAACGNLRVPHAWLLAVLHTFTVLSVIGFVYVNGFGYDVFVHEAAIAYIRSHGFILPKNPYYIGAYVVMLPILEAFSLSIGDLLRWFMPSVAAVLLPTVLYVVSDKSRPVPYWILWLTLFAPFTFSVPYNIALLIAVIAVLLVAHDRRYWVAVLCLAAVSVTAHPMVGLPVALIVLLLAGARRLERSFTFGFFATFVAVLLPLWVYVRLNGGEVLAPTLASLMDSARIVLHSPAVFSTDHPFWSLLYALYAVWPWIIFVLGCYGLHKKNRLLIGSACGVIIAAIVSASMLRYRDIVPQEQYEFAYRLIALAPWLVFSGLVDLATGLQKKFADKLSIPWFIGMASLITAAWFVAYPQYNPAMPYYAPSVGADDLAAAAWIKGETSGVSHVVLAPQLVSAGALRLTGFGPSISTADGNIYPYAIPTGGNLYRLYLETVTGRDMEQTLDRIKRYADVSEYVFVIPESWDPYGVLTRYFSEKAGSQKRIGELGIFVVDRKDMGEIDAEPARP